MNPQTAVHLEKAKIVDEIKENFEESKLFLVSDVRGLSVTSITGLRRDLVKNGARMKVYKNTMLRRALNELKFEYPEDLFKGPSAIIMSKDDPVIVCKSVMG